MIDPWLCTICGLHYSSASMGGPGICPSCDCGNFGPHVVKSQTVQLQRLRQEQQLNFDQINRLAASLGMLGERTDKVIDAALARMTPKAPYADVVAVLDDSKLALDMSRLVHNDCKDVPHDIGLRLFDLVRAARMRAAYE